MNRLIKIRYERLILAVVLLAVMMSLAWFWKKRGDSRHIKSVPVAVHLTKTDYKPPVLNSTNVARAEWSIPPAQSAGSGWVYELFTPPAVFYNRQTAKFTVIAQPDSVGSISAFNLEVVSVRRELYRVQLAGYFGEPGTYTAVFSSLEHGDVLFAREGERLKGLPLKLLSFSVQRLSPEHKDNWLVHEVTAVAELIDEKSGAKVSLDNRTQTFSGTAVATVKTSVPGSASQDVREGDVLSVQGSVYRIGHVQYEPAEVSVTREGKGGFASEDRILSPVTAGPDHTPTQVGHSKNFPSRPATGLVTNDQ